MLKLFPLLLIPALLTAQPAVNGRWFVVADVYGTPINFTMELKQDGDKLSVFGATTGRWETTDIGKP